MKNVVGDNQPPNSGAKLFFRQDCSPEKQKQKKLKQKNQIERRRKRKNVK